MLPTSVILATLFSAFFVVGILRKALIVASSLVDNAGSFTNQTARRLHIRKIVLSILPSQAVVLGDMMTASLDEIPISQFELDDSRTHIAGAVAQATGGTGAVAFTSNGAVISFNRNDLVLDSDESLFLNLSDIVGAMPVNVSANLWYET